jgi:hypothetical protein
MIAAGLRRFFFFLLLALPLAVLACSGSGSKGVRIEAVPTEEPGIKGSHLGEPGPTPLPVLTVEPPTQGRWIEVDVAAFRVRLMEGARVLETIEPVAVGVQVDSGDYESTQTGLFHVYNKIAGRQYDAPYKTWISDWVGFDPAKDNGFHSFLEDQAGKVVDARTGRVSNGCIRTGASDKIFAFAEIGMPVLVHS